MAQIFISHASKDEYFTNLLIELLRFHYVASWHSADDLQVGLPFPSQIERALKQANTLIAVVSANAAKSRWVNKEIGLFSGFNNQGKTIPILLDKTDPDDVYPGLSDTQAIPFTSCMLTGFERLFLEFGRNFLSFSERRTRQDRRKSGRRHSEERRHSSIIQRLRIGSWKAFSSETGRGKFEPLSLGVRETFQIIDALETEFRKYSLRDSSGRRIAARQVLEAATHNVISLFRTKETEGPVGAVYVVEAVAEEIYSGYQVDAIDRRKEDRRLAQERRTQSDSEILPKSKTRSAGGQPN